MTPHFIDTNIFMYAVGEDHPFKGPSQRLIVDILERKLEGIINTEVLQEILYRLAP